MNWKYLKIHLFASISINYPWESGYKTRRKRFSGHFIFMHQKLLI